MRLVIIFCFTLLLLNCEDKKYKKEIEPKNIPTKTEQTESEKESVVTEPEREFPVLTSKNSMEFFLKYEKENNENKVRLTTDFGDIDILLYNKTKFHRANFIFLTKQHYFEGTQFYRVINNFMVQAGNSDDRKTTLKRNKIGKYLLPTDTKRGYKHDRGVISMPSGEIDNPHKLASPFEFFIVQQHGGSHFLDGDYTIFGKVIKGMAVIDKIAAVKTDDADWPLLNIYIKRAEVID
jgi:peptidyl-prolyl cis-trans isomerase A (cyclophilin A)